jgi:ABC-type uncharacterized transport system substrate-binding protein
MPPLRRFRWFLWVCPIRSDWVWSRAWRILGGNVTGFAALVPEGYIGKLLQLLKEFVPQASRLAVLIDPTMHMHQLGLRELPEIERQLGVELVVVEASKPDQFETAFKTAQTRGAGGIHLFEMAPVWYRNRH